MKRIIYILSIFILFSCNSRINKQEEIKWVYFPDTVMIDGVYIPDVDGDGVIDFQEIDLEEISHGIEMGEVVRDENKLLMDTPLSNQGTLVYKVDSVLIIGVVSRVEARIIKQVSEETTEQLVSLTTRTSTGIIHEEIIKVGNIMDMELKTLDEDAITITEITDDEQLVDETDPTLWLWGVTANKIGSYNLILTAKIKQDGPTRDKIIFDTEINVTNKPKKKYSMIIDIPDNLKRYEDSIIRLNLIEKKFDTYSIEWGGEGKIVLEFDGKVTIITDDNIINDNKSQFNYKWVVTPKGKEKTLPYVIKIIGDYEDLVLKDSVLIVENNFKEGFNKFIDDAAQRWYWIFTALLIPIYGYIRKKYFPKKKK